MLHSIDYSFLLALCYSLIVLKVIEANQETVTEAIKIALGPNFDFKVINFNLG
jgi:hypothetical protein